MRQDQMNFYSYYLVAFQMQQNKSITSIAIDHIKDKQTFCCSQWDNVKNNSKPLPNYHRYTFAHNISMTSTM